MTRYSYMNKTPRIGDDVFIAQGAVLIGDCLVAAEVNIWFNSVIRADVNSITIGQGTNVQDMSMLHVTEKHALRIGAGVTIGHSAILHGCEVGDGSLIGMGAKVLDGAIIGKNCLVAAGSLVTPGKEFADGSFIMGSPAKTIRELSPEEIEQYSKHYKSYLEYAKDYMNSQVVKELK